MKAIILAAGKGSRLNGLAGGDPKCLVKIGGMSLIERQIMSLRFMGVEEIVAVVGYRADRVREVCGDSITYIENSRFGQTNSLFSLWLASDFLSDGFVVLNADVLFHPRMLLNLLSAGAEDALLIAYSANAATALGDEEMKVKVDNGRVIDISKRLPPDEADGENVGIVKFGVRGARLLREEMAALISAGADCEWAPRAFREFALKRPLFAVGTGDLPWIEIDFPADYERAVTEVLPGIEAFDEDLAEAALMAGSALES